MLIAFTTLILSPLVVLAGSLAHMAFAAYRDRGATVIAPQMSDRRHKVMPRADVGQSFDASTVPVNAAAGLLYTPRRPFLGGGKLAA